MCVEEGEAGRQRDQVTGGLRDKERLRLRLRLRRKRVRIEFRGWRGKTVCQRTVGCVSEMEARAWEQLGHSSKNHLGKIVT
jgi:hypothetical protein